jgi:hypothetical protein
MSRNGHFGHDLPRCVAGSPRPLDFKREREALGLDLGGSISEAPSQDYFFTWGPRAALPRPANRAWKLTRPQVCFRAYFTWDDEEQKVIIGWPPTHLPTRAT